MLPVVLSTVNLLLVPFLILKVLSMFTVPSNSDAAFTVNRSVIASPIVVLPFNVVSPSTLRFPSTSALSVTLTVPPAESRIKLPVLVSISLSSVTPT